MMMMMMMVMMMMMISSVYNDEYDVDGALTC